MGKKYQKIFVSMICFAATLFSTQALSAVTTIPAGNYTISSDGDYQLENGYTGTITIANTANTLTVMGAANGETNINTNIVAEDGRSADLSLTIKNLKTAIEQSSGWIAVSGIKFLQGAGLENRLLISGACSIGGAGNGAGIEVPSGVRLTVNKVTSDTDDTLTTSMAPGNGINGYTGAGIGGWAHSDGGQITISGGMINVVSYSGAGIGGGGNNDTVTITGGIVNASSGIGAGIGGGEGARGGTVNISGGVVTAISYGAYHAAGGAGIGGGGGNYQIGLGGTVNISSGTVTATGTMGAGIGGGTNGSGGTVIISGGTVTATGSYSAGIGGGYGGVGAAVTITGTPTIVATGDLGNGAEHIGHGYGNANSGTLTDGNNNLTYLRFNVKDASSNNIPGAAVKVAGYAYITDSNGLTGCMVTQSAGTEAYTVSGAGYATAHNGTPDFLNPPLMNLDVAVTLLPANLAESWNFISFPKLPSGPTDAATVFADVSGSVNVVWGYNNATKSWLKWQPSNPASALTNLDFGAGYWVHMKEPARIDMGAWLPPASQTVSLSQGWNLVGYSGTDGAAASAALNNSIADKWFIAWTWQTGQWSALYSKNVALSVPSLTVFRRGYAYWVRMKEGQNGDWVQ